MATEPTHPLPPGAALDPAEWVITVNGQPIPDEAMVPIPRSEEQCLMCSKPIGNRATAVMGPFVVGSRTGAMLVMHLRDCAEAFLVKLRGPIDLSIGKGGAE